MKEKIKILTLSDHPGHPSGVAHGTRIMIEAMLKTGRYEFVCLGGAIKHQDYRPVKFEEYGDNWIVYPVDGYGTAEQVRAVIKNHKPDILWFMTDPRYFQWLVEIEDEIRPLIPMVYYCLWDNLPVPKYNEPFYSSIDVKVPINKQTVDILNELDPNYDVFYLPHVVDTNIFKKIEGFDPKAFKEKHFGDGDKFLCFFNGRNARRKQTGSLIYWFKTFLDIVGHDKATLLMHTEVKDPNGQDLEVIVKDFELDKGQVLFSEQKMPPENLAQLYNASDVLINISDAEGFGYSVLEAKACETPVLCTYTGGMKEQIKDDEGNTFGYAVKPTSQAVIGSQQVPYIFEDRISEEEFVKGLKTLYQMTPEERAEIGRKAREDVMKRFNFEEHGKKWDEIFQFVYDKYGSWNTRKNYRAWELKEIK